MRPSHRMQFLAAAAAIIAIGCAKKDAATPSTTADSTAHDTSAMSSSAAPAAAPGATTTPPTDITPVRGKVVAFNDSQLTVSTANGNVQVKVVKPLQLFTREKGDLSRVTDHTFVGITSIAQKDDTQLATEIHTFPEEMRGTGEGSYPMTGPGAPSHSTMTNGAVASGKASSAPMMTNGSVAKHGNKTLTIQYKGSSRDIVVPDTVPVMSIVQAHEKLAVGSNVVVLAKKQADGSLEASRVVFARAP